jgi:hypothetical protein
MDIFLSVVTLVVGSFLLGISLKRLKHDTGNMELFEEGWQLLQTETLYITDEQRDELVEHVYDLMKYRRYAIFDTIFIVINLVCLMFSGYYIVGHLI